MPRPPPRPQPKPPPRPQPPRPQAMPPPHGPIPQPVAGPAPNGPVRSPPGIMHLLVARRNGHVGSRHGHSTGHTTGCFSKLRASRHQDRILLPDSVLAGSTQTRGVLSCKTPWHGPSHFAISGIARRAPPGVACVPQAGWAALRALHSELPNRNTTALEVGSPHGDSVATAASRSSNDSRTSTVSGRFVSAADPAPPSQSLTPGSSSSRSSSTCA